MYKQMEKSMHSSLQKLLVNNHLKIIERGHLHSQENPMRNTIM